LTEPHVESFDYFLEFGLTRGVKDIVPAKVDLLDMQTLRDEGLEKVDWSEMSTVRFWMEDVKIAKPVKATSGGTNKLLPRE
jgi:hypothetical protein